MYVPLFSLSPPLQGSAFTAIEPEPDINALCYLPEKGLLLLATNDTKMLAYYIPVSHQDLGHNTTMQGCL